MLWETKGMLWETKGTPYTSLLLLCRWVVSISMQINAVLEEVLGWRTSYFLLLNETQPATLELFRPPTRLCTMYEQKLKKLANSTICPVVALAILDAKAMHASGRHTDPERYAHLLRTNQLAMAYVVHDKRSRSMPRLASAVKREIADAVNAIGVSLQSYEVQPLLDACRRNYRAQKWDPLVNTHSVQIYTHSPANSLSLTDTHSLTCSLTHSPTHPLTRSLTRSLTHSLTHPLTHSLTTHSLIRSIIYHLRFHHSFIPIGSGACSSDLAP